MGTTPQMNYDQLRKAIIDGYSSYSKGFKAIAKVIIDTPHMAAVKNIADLGTEAGVSAATLLRFITSLGFSGYSDFQQIFKSNLVSQFHDYQQTLIRSPHNENGSHGLLHEINNLTNKGMSALLKETNAEQLDNIARHLHNAYTIHLCAFRRLYPVCVYLYYTLTHLGRQAALIDGHAGLHEEQARQITDKDALIVMSTHPYASEAQKVADIACSQNASLIVVTDSQLSPFYPLSDKVIIVNDIRVRNIRIPTTTLSIMQALCLSMVYLDT